MYFLLLFTIIAFLLVIDYYGWLLVELLSGWINPINLLNAIKKFKTLWWER